MRNASPNNTNTTKVKTSRAIAETARLHHALEHVRILLIVKNRLERKDKGKEGNRARDGACNDSEQIGYLKHWRPHFPF